MNENKVDDEHLVAAVNFKKFTSVNLSKDQLQRFKRSTVINPSINLLRWISQS